MEDDTLSKEVRVMSKRQNKDKILQRLSLRPSLCGTKNPVMENCAEVKFAFN